MKTCPIHAAPLSKKPLDAAEVEHCPTCAGMWLPAAVVERALGTLVRPAAVLRAGQATPLRCPDDGAALVVFHHHGVEIDLCTLCSGVWLDRGELERILRQRKGQTMKNAADEVASHAKQSIDISELSGDAIGAVFEVIGDLLSGL